MAKQRLTKYGGQRVFDSLARPSVMYSEMRAKWLEHAAQQLLDAEGDDEWMDWVEEGENLKKRKEY
jgi:hypothetical protein